MWSPEAYGLTTPAGPQASNLLYRMNLDVLVTLFLSRCTGFLLGDQRAEIARLIDEN